MNSLYSLSWCDYSASLVSAVQLLRCHGDLVDCTLAAGGRSFPAHKIVLCAASPFLLDLLKVTFKTLLWIIFSANYTVSNYVQIRILMIDFELKKNYQKIQREISMQ